MVIIIGFLNVIAGMCLCCHPDRKDIKERREQFEDVNGGLVNKDEQDEGAGDANKDKE